MNEESGLPEPGGQEDRWRRALLVFQIIVGLSGILALLFAVAVHYGWL
jgi:hypothetical protein